MHRGLFEVGRAQQSMIERRDIYIYEKKTFLLTVRYNCHLSFKCHGWPSKASKNEIIEGRPLQTTVSVSASTNIAAVVHVYNVHNFHCWYT
jgi:hypothetical protein